MLIYSYAGDAVYARNHVSFLPGEGLSMQELWSDDPKVVGEEIIRLVGQRLPVTLFQKGLDPQKLTPAEIFTKEAEPLLLFAKELPFQAPKDPSLFLYQHHNQPMRGFHATPAFETSSELGVLFPASIITIQRRKIPATRPAPAPLQPSPAREASISIMG